MSDYHFPNELWVQIFARLPVKSLIRFRSVCKSWYSLITNPSFIATHLDRTIADSKTSSGNLLLRFYSHKDKREHYFLCRDDEKFGDKKMELDFPFKTKYGYFRVVGCCNGLLCLCDACLSCLPDDFTTIIGNPSIREWVILPRPHKPQRRPYEVVLGFGANTTSHEYKLVRIVYEKEQGSSLLKVPPEVQIYAQSTGSWRGIASFLPNCKVELLWSQVFLNGAVHWLANHPSKAGGYDRSIVSFDMDDEVFGEMTLPPALAIQASNCLSIMSFGESLAVLLSGSEMGESACSVWVMRDYGVAESWCKLYSIIYPQRVMCRTLGFRKNGEALLTIDGWLVSYDPVSKTIREIGITGGSYSFRVDTFMESLLLLKGQNGAFKGSLNPFDDCIPASMRGERSIVNAKGKQKQIFEEQN